MEATGYPTTAELNEAYSRALDTINNQRIRIEAADELVEKSVTNAAKLLRTNSILRLQLSVALQGLERLGIHSRDPWVRETLRVIGQEIKQAGQ